jgi:hypothetical protein
MRERINPGLPSQAQDAPSPQMILREKSKAKGYIRWPIYWWNWNFKCSIPTLVFPLPSGNASNASKFLQFLTFCNQHYSLMGRNIKLSFLVDLMTLCSQNFNLISDRMAITIESLQFKPCIDFLISIGSLFVFSCHPLMHSFFPSLTILFFNNHS